MRPTLVVFVKAPRPGRVKTRLARDIGTVEAAWWFRHQSAALIRRLSRDRRWRTVLAVTPDAEGLRSRAWPARLARAGQGEGDLGRRMARFLRREPGTGVPPAPVAIVGADIPALTPAHVADAFRVLRGHAAVLGPAADGGYWLIGLSAMARVRRDVLTGVRWSTEHALADTVARLDGLSVRFAATLADVDTAADLRAAAAAARQ
ncbi:MAG TPA: TIGR04282 family arsenosugar biosynthesis glycosyltransferase [Paracoccaceae bacterium]|nr:TIGR04282 family arsenosugar biosynthesis glycosyltransferase [Paracoccaceae bacterium]